MPQPQQALTAAALPEQLPGDCAAVPLNLSTAPSACCSHPVAMLQAPKAQKDVSPWQPRGLDDSLSCSIYPSLKESR
eukprot:30337_5